MKRSAYKSAPNDSRYIPFTQQSYCCVPTSIQMIMYRNGLPLIPSEEIGYHLGLTVPPEDESLFYDVRVAKKPPSGAGYGTQIYNPDYEPNKALEELGVPLRFSQKLASDIKDEAELIEQLKKVEEEGTDALICFNHGVIRGDYEPNSGHVVVFDRIIDNKVRVVDASPRNPKWRLLEPGLILAAIKQHGNENSGGVWFFKEL